VRRHDARSGGRAWGLRALARSAPSRNGDAVDEIRPADAPANGEREGQPSKESGLRNIARVVGFGALTWTLGAFFASVVGVWGSSSVPLLSAALLLVLPVVLLGIALVLRIAYGPEARPAEADVVDVSNGITGLPGEAYFHKRLKEEMGRARRHDRTLAVVLVDVNHLRSVNEQYDHSCGDEVLRHLARVLESTTRAHDSVAHLRDDCFALLLPECSEEGVDAFVRRLEDRLAREPARAHHAGQVIMLWVGVCTGLAILGAEATDPSELLALAEADLRVAKDHLRRRRQRWLSA
jgi:diguanylate cyclase (GGDEF)-like protein